MKRNSFFRYGVRVSIRFIALFFVISSVYAGIPGVITTTDGRKLAGEIRWQPASRMYSVTTGGISVKIPVDDVTRIKIDKPSALKSAIQKTVLGNYSEAIPELKRIADEYRMMEYDITATRWLAEVYLKTGKPKEAVRACEAVKRNRKGFIEEIHVVYTDGLFETQQFSKLRKELDRAIAFGSRDLAARAFIKRGDIKMKQGRFREALVDGYLRVVVFFQSSGKIQPEALFMAARCFSNLGQSAYADKMKDKLMTLYPDSAYARKLQGG